MNIVYERNPKQWIKGKGKEAHNLNPFYFFVSNFDFFIYATISHKRTV